MNLETVRRKIEVARMRIISGNHFLGLILINTNILSDSSFDTLATNGIDIFYNPLFLKDLSIEHIAFTIEHELYHKVLLHCERREDKDAEIWNIAIDIATHCNMIKAGKYIDIIKSNRYYYDSKCHGMNADQIYWYLMSDKDKQKQQKGFNPIDKHINASPSNRTHEKSSIINQVRSAFKVSGDCSDGAMLDLKNDFLRVTSSTHSLKDLLRKYFENAFTKHDYDFMARDIRFHDSDFSLPSIVNINEKKKLKKVAAVFDTSLSISKHEHFFFADVVSDLSSEFCDELHLIFCDDNVQRHDIIEGTINDFYIPQGFGTAFKPVFDYIEKNNIDIGLLIYLTDLCVSDRKISSFTPKYNVVWVKTTSPFEYITPWFGEVIDFEI